MVNYVKNQIGFDILNCDGISRGYAMAATLERLLTADEYGKLPNNGKPTELVRGRIVEMNMPYPRHGEICMHIVRILLQYLALHDLGRLLINDAGIVTERGPDTVRGADVSFLSYKRRPRGALPRNAYIDEVPELIFEVRWPSDKWAEIIVKVGEYLSAGANTVCVLDEQTHTARIYTAEEPEQKLDADQELTFPAILPGFAATVSRFFE
jgi:Uma2 family endonuclease